MKLFAKAYKIGRVCPRSTGYVAPVHTSFRIDPVKQESDPGGVMSTSSAQYTGF
jgi:hypothetical protein